MKQSRALFLTIFLTAILIAQIGSPFAILSAIAPVAGVSGVQLAYDTTNKVVWIQSIPPGSTAPVNILSLNPHVLDGTPPGNFSITINIPNGTPVSVLLSTVTSGTSDFLVYRLSNGNPSQDKLCSNATPLPTGAVVCSVIPF